MKDKDTLVVFDFDNTLFKTREFWREYLFPFYEKVKIPRETIESAFIKATKIRAAGYFVQSFFIDELYLAAKNYRKKQLQDIFESRIYNIAVKKYFYPGALDLIKKARRKYKAILVSYGDNKFKKRFFASCGINKYFATEEIIITKTKEDALTAKIATFKRCIIINDSEDENKKISLLLKDKRLKVRSFLVNNKHNKQSSTCQQLIQKIL